MNSPTPTPGASTSSGPLSGLRVVEISSFVATPLCGLTLQQLGAEVIRIEPLGGGPDRGRWPITSDGVSLYWNGLNPGKLGVEVDLTSAEGRRLVADLVTEIGIVVSNTERWPELTHDALAERRGDLISVLLTGTRDGGTAVDYTVQAGTGFPLVTGPSDHTAPVNHLLPAWDLAAGLYLGIGLLAAERNRMATGRGSQVRLALEDVALASAANLGYLSDAMLNPASTRRPDGNYVYGTFGRDFSSSDGYRFMLVALTERQWSDLRTVTGLGEVIDRLGDALAVDFTDEGARYEHREVLAALVARWFSRHTAEQVRAALMQTRLLWSPYRSFADLAASDAALLRENPMFAELDQPGLGPVLGSGSPLQVNGRRSAPRPAPAVGEHTEQVLSRFLGLTPDGIAELTERGVVRGPRVPQRTA